MTTIIRPAVSTLQFYSARHVDDAARDTLAEPWVTRFGPVAREDDTNEWRCGGDLPGGVSCAVRWIRAHDTLIQRSELSLVGPASPEVLASLRTQLDALLEALELPPAAPMPWAESHLYVGELPGGGVAAPTSELESAGLRLPLGWSGQLEATPFGWVWATEDESGFRRGRPIHQRTLMLLIPEPRASRVKPVLLEPSSQGVVRIELYMQKCGHHARQYHILRSTLLDSQESLQTGMLMSLRTTDFSEVYREHRELEDLARRLMHFQSLRAQGEILHSSMQSNLESLTEHLEFVKFESVHYDDEIARLRRTIEQLQQDLHNAQIVSDSTYSLHEIQQSVQSTRMERAGFLMGGAAAVLAAVAIFNSFLDIWSLTVEGTDLALPTPGLRILLSALAAIGWSVGAYWLVERRRLRAAIALALGFGALTAAALTTILTHR
jgi:hypothetical protein